MLLRGLSSNSMVNNNNISVVQNAISFDGVNHLQILVKTSTPADCTC